MKTFLQGCAWGLVAVVFFLLMTWAFNVSEQQECVKWQGYATSLNSFYLTAAEAAQCNYWHIEVKAPIK